jgi:hypothetical protein
MIFQVEPIVKFTGISSVIDRLGSAPYQKEVTGKVILYLWFLLHIKEQRAFERNNILLLVPGIEPYKKPVTVFFFFGKLRDRTKEYAFFRIQDRKTLFLMPEKQDSANKKGKGKRYAIYKVQFPFVKKEAYTKCYCRQDYANGKEYLARFLIEACNNPG